MRLPLPNISGGSPKGTLLLIGAIVLTSGALFLIGSGVVMIALEKLPEMSKIALGVALIVLGAIIATVLVAFGLYNNR